MSEEKTAFEEASKYLGYRMRTESEVREHLEEKGFGQEETDGAVAELTDLGYIDDIRYAEVYIEYAKGKRRGRRRIRLELEEKGIAGDTAENAINDYYYENNINESGEALEIAMREFREPADGDDREALEKEIARIARKLERLGFANDDIFKVMSSLRSKH
jgi:regulatory protein